MSDKRLNLSATEDGESPRPSARKRGKMRQGMMETVSGLLRLGGDVRNEVPLRDATPAELVVLTAIHGGTGTLTALKATGEIARSAQKEKRRLTALYPRYAAVTETLFPGLRPALPQTLAEAQALFVEEDEEAEDDATDLLAN